MASALDRLQGLRAIARDEGWAEWIRSEADERAVLAGCWFDRDAGRRVCDFFERFLVHTKGEWAGKPFTLFEWQKKDLLMPLFGWRRRSGERRFRKAYIEVPKKNGKSGICSGIALYLLMADGEPGAEVYAAAADRDQAAIVYGEAEKMVLKSAPLQRHLRVVSSRKTIIYGKTLSYFRCLSADVPTKEGLNIHGLIFDEIHAQRSRELFDTLQYGGAARRQPLLVSITTAGYDKNSICWEQHEYADKVLRGVVEDHSFFPLIYAADETDDWTAPEVWKKANPSFGLTIKADAFAEECREAQEKPSQQNSFKRYRLNLWTSSETRWMDAERWKASGGAPVDEAALEGRECWGGLDLASTIDVAACVLLFPEDDGGYLVLPKFWIPEDNMRDRSFRDRVPYDAWVRQGLMTATPGNVIDYAWIRADIEAAAGRFALRELAYDPWNSSALVSQLQEGGVAMVPVRQGFASLSGPMKELETLVFQKKFRHGGNPVLRWMADNVQAVMDPAGNIKPDKGRSREKIDGVVACIMALSRASLRDTRGSAYEERGIITL